MTRALLRSLLMLGLAALPAHSAEPLADTATLQALNEQVRADVRLQIQAPMIRAVFSLGVPGTGQWFNAEEGKFRTHLAVGIALPVATLGTAAALQLRAIDMARDGNVYEFENAQGAMGIVAMTGGLLSLGWHLYSAWDAYGQAMSRLQAGPFQPRLTPEASAP